MVPSLSSRPQFQYLTEQMDQLKKKGAHFRPGMPEDEQARVRTNMTSEHTRQEIDQALEILVTIARQGLLS